MKEHLGNGSANGLDEGGPSCRLETLLEDLIPMLMEHQKPIQVLDHQDELVGEVHRDDVILAMAH